MTRRRQATLYLPLPNSDRVESLRSQFNRDQFELIRAHVTLCREDEVSDWGELASRLLDLGRIEVELEFGMPIRDNNLVYLPAIGSTDSFDSLRNAILASKRSLPRKHSPHITLIHPRNGLCTDAVFDEITAQSEPFAINFRCVTMIEQVHAERWRELATFG